MEDIKFRNPIQTLDEWINAEENGASLMLSDDDRLEMELRKKQLLDEIDDEYDIEEDDDFAELVRQHKEDMASVPDVMGGDVPFRKLPQRIMDEIADGFSCSYVRNDPLSDYNIPEEELYKTREHQEICQRLSRVRNIYYDAISFRNAMLIIQDAIMYSLKHDYPWYGSFEDVLRDFNAGKIKYRGNIPKLYLGFGERQITDPKILAGIVSGDVEIIEKQEADRALEERARKKRKKEKVVPVHEEYEILPEQRYTEYARAHNMGYDTPISMCLRNGRSLFDRLSMPWDTTPQKKNVDPPAFDWFQDNAGEIYFNQMYGITPNIASKLADSLNKANGGNLRPVILSNISEFVRELSNGQYGEPSRQMVADQQRNQQALQIEQTILDNIRRSNGM